MLHHHVSFTSHSYITTLFGISRKKHLHIPKNHPLFIKKYPVSAYREFSSLHTVTFTIYNGIEK